MPCAPFRMTFSTPRCFSTYSLPFALQNQWVCVAVYSMSLSLLPLLHLHGCSFSNTMKITNMVSINLMLKLPCGGRWSLLLLHGPCPPHIHKMWCLQVRTLHCGVSKEGLLKGQWGIHRGWQPVAYLEEISSQESSELAGWHPGPYWSCSSFTWASRAVFRIRSQSPGYPVAVPFLSLSAGCSRRRIGTYY